MDKMGDPSQKRKIDDLIRRKFDGFYLKNAKKNSH